MGPLDFMPVLYVVPFISLMGLVLWKLIINILQSPAKETHVIGKNILNLTPEWAGEVGVKGSKLPALGSINKECPTFYTYKTPLK